MRRSSWGASFWLLPLSGGEVNVGNLSFLLLLITLIVTLYDRYRIVYDARLAASGGVDD